MDVLADVAAGRDHLDAGREALDRRMPAVRDAHLGIAVAGTGCQKLSPSSGWTTTTSVSRNSDIAHTLLALPLDAASHRAPPRSRRGGSSAQRVTSDQGDGAQRQEGQDRVRRVRVLPRRAQLLPVGGTTVQLLVAWFVG